MKNTIYNLKPSQEFGGYTDIASCLAVFWNSQLCERQAKNINLGADESVTANRLQSLHSLLPQLRIYLNTSVDFFDDDSRIGVVNGYDRDDGEEQKITIFITNLDYDKKEIIVLTRDENQSAPSNHLTI